MKNTNIYEFMIDSNFSYEYYCPICDEWHIVKSDEPIVILPVNVCDNCRDNKLTRKQLRSKV